MLPPFIIEQIRKREEDEKRRRIDQQPRLQLPLERADGVVKPPMIEEAPRKRGVIILDLG